jgi:hypothetical protein
MTPEVAMKRRVVIILVSVVLLCALGCAGLYAWWSYGNQLTEQRARELAQQVADALGRTPADAIVDFRSCGMFACGYNVYFTSLEDFAGMDARLHALSTLHLHVGIVAPGGGIRPLLDMNGELGRTRLTASSASPYREPGFSSWTLLNEQGETVCSIYLYNTKNTGVTYLFDGKPLPNANIVELYTDINPSKW